LVSGFRGRSVYIETQCGLSGCDHPHHHEEAEGEDHDTEGEIGRPVQEIVG
jgi:hypothetical protein